MKRAIKNLGALVLTVSIICFGFSPAHAQSYPDLTMWVDQWFKVSIMLQELLFEGVGVPPDSLQYVEHDTGYLVFTTSNYPTTPPILTYTLYVPNGSGVWNRYDLTLDYKGGDENNFAGLTDFSSATERISVAVQIKGTKKKDGTFTGATIKSLAGFHYSDEISEIWLGSLKFNGSWVNPATLCKNTKNSTLPPCIP